MTNSKTTKRALFSSVIALILCCSMLVGTTFAWFTDSVESMNNVITAGNLDVEVTQNNTDIREIELFDDILWEPGVVAYENLTVTNKGTLALKYNMSVIFNEENYVYKDENGVKTPYGLSEALKVVVVKRHIESETTRGELLNSIAASEWKYLQELSENGFLLPDDENPDTHDDVQDYAIVIYWQPGDNDNNWNVLPGKEVSDGKNHLHINLGINLIATQYTHETDSFNKEYDELAWIPTAGFGVGIVAEDIDVRNDSGTKIGSVLVDTDSVVNEDEDIKVTFELVSDLGNFVVQTGMETLAYNITVTNLKANNTENATVQIRLPAGLDPRTVKAHHYAEEIESSYNPNTGYVTFKTPNFSPFIVVYDAESKYEPVERPEGLPVASVVRSEEYENTELDWGAYGQWSPTEGLESNLEAAYTFSCTETFEEAKENDFAYWYCDFYVELSEDLGENELFLGGNYGSFGWVGFHNGDVTLEANTEIGLLESVTTNPWTYLDVVQNVGTFICGVGDVDDALSGATFTVTLRLTNPDDVNDSHDIATIEYVFK